MRFLGLLSAILAFGASSAYADTFSSGEFDEYPANVEMGQRLFNAAACGSCHGTKGKIYDPALPELGGGVEIDNHVYGRIRVPNISGDKAEGIGSWSRSEFLNAMIYGVSPSGGNYIPIHPFEFYAGMKPEHVVDIFEYIKAELPESGRKSEAHERPISLRRVFGFSNPVSYRFDPDQVRKDRQVAGLGDDPSNSALWGEYLVEHVAACGSCHTARDGSFNLLKGGEFQATLSALGNNDPIGLTVTEKGIAPLIPDRNEFEHKFINQGLRLDGSSKMQGSMAHVAASLALLSVDDKAAIHQYLKDLPAPQPYEIKASCEAPSAPVRVAGSNGTDLTKKVDGWLQRQCKSCHIRGASAAQEALLARADSVATDSSLIAPGRPEQSLLYQSISGTKGVAPMPPGGGVSATDLALVKQWIEALEIDPQAVAPIDAALSRDASRDHVSPASVFAAVQRHIQSIDERDQRNIRYFSFQSYFNGHLPCQQEEAFVRQHLTPHLAALNKLLNSLSTSPEIVKVEPVEGSPYVFFIDISDLHWDIEKWNVLVSGDIPGLSEPKPYPYGANPSGLNADAALKVVAELTKTNTPIMRADWFVGNAGQPLHYKFLLGLPDNVHELERDILDVDLNETIKSDPKDVIRLGFLEGSSGVSKNNRLLDRIDLPNGGYYWLSYDFDRPVKIDSPRRLKEYPLGPEEALPHLPSFEHDGGEMLFSLPNGLQGYYLTDPDGNYLEKGPVEVVFHPVEAGYLSPVFGPEIANGAGCMACHLNGVIPAVDQIKDAVISEGLLPSLGDQRAYFEALYADKDTVSAIMNKDIKHYLDALAAVDGDPGLKTDLQGPGIFHEEPVTNLMSVYFEPVGREKLAAEFGFTFSDLQARTDDLANTDRAKNILSSWFVALETRGVVERSEVERNFQTVYAALYGTEPRLQDLHGNEKPTALVGVGQPYVTRPGLSITVSKSEIKVCEPASFIVETDQACLLDVIYPDTNKGKFVRLSEAAVGNLVLQPGEKRQIPQPGRELQAHTPSTGVEIAVNCYVGLTSYDQIDSDVLGSAEEYAASNPYQKNFSEIVSRATEGAITDGEQLSRAPITSTIKFVIFDDPTALKSPGVCK